MEDKPNDFRLIDPRQQEIEQTTSNLYMPAMKELGWEPPLYVLLYNQIRYYEDFGKLKVGYSVASKQALAEQFGVTIAQIEQAYNHLTNTYHLGSWVICDEKVFRNVKKVWVSNVRQARGSMEDVVKMLENSHKMRAKLSQHESKTLIAGELPSLDDPCPKVIESNELESEKLERLETNVVFPQLVSKFRRAGFQIINKKQLKEKTDRLLDTIYEDGAQLTLVDIIDAADKYINGSWEHKTLQNFLSPNIFPYCVTQKTPASEPAGGYNPWEGM